MAGYRKKKERGLLNATLTDRQTESWIERKIGPERGRDSVLVYGWITNVKK